MSKFSYQVSGGGARFTPPARGAEGGVQARHARREPSPPRRPAFPPASPAAGGPRRKVRQDDVIYFATQLAVMVDTGVPLTEALDAISQQTEHAGLRAMVEEICQEIKAGEEFSSTLQKRSKTFGRLFISLIKASEATGKMGLMLQRVSEYLQEERDTRKKVKGALVYPMCMLSFCVLVVAGMLIFVLPRFEKIYAGKGVVLPAPTRVLLAISGALTSYWYLFLPALAGLVAGFWFFVRTPTGGDFMDRVRIGLPVLGGMYRKACLARCLRAMATMVSAGVSVLDMLAITAQVAGNSIYAALWKGLAGGVQQGSSISEQLMQHKLVPRTITQMIAAGEKTGRLATVLDRVAGFCETDLRVAVKTVTNMIEPTMIIVMGLVIGAIAMALLLPVFSISKVVAH